MTLNAQSPRASRTRRLTRNVFISTPRAPPGRSEPEARGRAPVHRRTSGRFLADLPAQEPPDLDRVVERLGDAFDVLLDGLVRVADETLLEQADRLEELLEHAVNDLLEGVRGLALQAIGGGGDFAFLVDHGLRHLGPGNGRGAG